MKIFHHNEYITIPDDIKKYSEFFDVDESDFLESDFILFHGTKKDIEYIIEYLSIQNKTTFEIENDMPIIPNKPIQDFLSKEELNWLKSIEDKELEDLMIFTDYILYYNLLYVLCYFYVNKKSL